ncbi:MAG: hypothetical protein KDB23_03895 [Planctomycetales bacterium]|nr:hypothetical protein [Planctomycetales bacterium]
MNLNPRQLASSVLRVACIAMLLTCFTATGHASPALRKELSRICDRVATILSAKGVSTIAVGSFTGPATFPSSGGPGIIQILKEELETRQIEVVRQAQFGLKGNFAMTELKADSPFPVAPSERQVAVRVTVTMVDQFDNPVTEFVAAGNSTEKRESEQITLQDEETITKLIGMTTSLDPAASLKERNQHIRDQFTGVQQFGSIRDQVLFSDASSPFGIQLLVGDAVREIVPTQAFAYVALQEGETYTIRIHNQADFDAAVALSIDGISSFAFSSIHDPSGSPASEYYLVPARSDITIRGWFRSTADVHEFTVTPESESAAAQLKQTTKLGTITASFRAAWRHGSPPPRDEQVGTKGAGSQALGTGLGALIPQDSQVVQRDIGVLRSTVSLRYDRPDR